MCKRLLLAVTQNTETVWYKQIRNYSACNRANHEIMDWCFVGKHKTSRGIRHGKKSCIIRINGLNYLTYQNLTVTTMNVITSIKNFFSQTIFGQSQANQQRKDQSSFHLDCWEPSENDLNWTRFYAHFMARSSLSRPSSVHALPFKLTISVYQADGWSCTYGHHTPWQINVPYWLLWIKSGWSCSILRVLCRGCP